MSFDVLIVGGHVADGTGRPAFRADIGIVGKQIEAVGNLGRPEVKREIDASGLIICPGFIDTHVHADGALLNDGQHACGILQGVTTEIITADGIGLAPLSQQNFKAMSRYLSGILGKIPEHLDMSSIEAARGNYHKRTSCNVAMFAGHGPIRLEAAGFRDLPLRGDTLTKAKRLLTESLEQGCCGFATGLSYYPQSFSDSQELVELCETAAKFGAPFSVHLRNHNVDRAFHGGGVLEAIEVCRRSGARLHLEHYRTQPYSAGQLEELLAPVEEAQAEGIDVTMETYGYPVGSSHPPQFFPSWAHEGGADLLLERLRDPRMRSRLREAIQTQMPNGIADNSWSWIGSSQNSGLQGLSFSDAADRRGETVEDMVMNVMVEEEMACGFRANPPVSAAIWRQVEADIMHLMTRPDYMVGSDAIPVGRLPHPRAWGCFVRMLGRLRRRHNVHLETLISRMTELPARRFGLKNRGAITEGAFADIAVFDPELINDRATFEDPCQPAEGVHFVLVNGAIAVDKGRTTGVLAGEAVP